MQVSISSWCCLEELPKLTVQEDCTAGVLIQCLNGLNQTFLYVEASENLSQVCIPDSVKLLLEVYEVVEQIALVLKVRLYDDSAIEDLFLCAPAWSTDVIPGG